MSYNGSGTFVINTAGQPVVSGTVISSTAFNALTADLATGLSTAITKDGQTTPTANIPMGNNKITGLAVGTAATDAANLSQVQSTAAKLVNSVSGADTITGTMSPTLAAYATGQMFYFVAASANTGAVTINIDSLGAKSITRDGTTALAAGDIQSGEVCVIVYDGTQFQLVNGASQSASIVTENLTVNKATVLNESGGDNDTRIEGDTDANLFFADASTDRIGIGTSSPSQKLHVYQALTNSTAYGIFENNRSRNAAVLTKTTNGGFYTGTSVGTDTLCWQVYDETNGERLRIDASGNLGLGVTPVASFAGYKTFQIASQGYISSDSTSNGELEINNNAYRAPTTAALTYINSFAATKYAQYQGAHNWFTAPSGTAGNTITFTQAMTLDASGNLVIGKTSTNLPGKLDVQADTNSGGVSYVRFQNGASTNAAGTAISIMLGDTADNRAEIRGVTSDASNGFLSFWTQGSGTRAERARISSGGSLLVGKTAVGSLATAGCEIEPAGTGVFTVSAAPVVIINRLTDDGVLINFYQATTVEGNISVSGNTVSYNAFAGSHWSQLQDGSKPDILRGTVMESINELCVWPDEQNERLPKAKISDTAGSKKVYGVFMAWDNDWATTNDMYITAVGAFICRVNGSVTVQEGDLLESNGDGTARVQADDIIRSSTIGKVTSTVKTHEYDDGSYCVPTVLYCG